MRRYNQYIPLIISYFFILLFCYAAISKILDFENFKIQIGQSPLLSAYANFISFAVIVAELVIVVCLVFPNIRLFGLYSSTAIMSAFTIYIYLILNYSDFIPCSCGGILEKLGWTEHLIFNLVCVAVGIIAILQQVMFYRKSLKRHTLFLLATNFLSIALVVALFLSSEHIIKKENNFTRRFLIHPVIEKETFPLDNDQYYFAGSHGSELYLGNRKYPLSFSTLDTALTRIRTVYLHPDREDFPFRNISVKAVYPFYYVYDGSVPVILRGKVGSTNPVTVSFQDAYFHQLAVIDSTTFALRTQSAETKSLLLAKLSLRRRHVQLYPNILTKQIDGVFDMDGTLISDPGRQLAYIYAYRNEFIVTDAELGSVRRFNTIDTTRTAQIKITQLSDGTHQMQAPPVKVNNGSGLYRGLLFNQSLLRGKHESRSAWRKADVIDVYKTDSQYYVGSFYLYRKKGAKLNGFLITEQSLYAIYGEHLIRYKLTGQISKYFEPGEAENPFKE